MPVSLPFLVAPSAPAVPAVLAGVPDGLSAAKPETTFAALIGAQLQAEPDVASAPAAAGLVGELPSALQQRATHMASAGASALTKAAAAASAGIVASGTETADGMPVATTATAAPPIIVSAGPPKSPPNETQLTQAAGGEDDSAEAADAAVAAAIDAGVAPKQSERLVLAASLPISVRSAASVRVLDQLLDSVLPAPASALVAPAADGTIATTVATTELPSAPSALASLDGSASAAPQAPSAPIPSLASIDARPFVAAATKVTPPTDPAPIATSQATTAQAALAGQASLPPQLGADPSGAVQIAQPSFGGAVQTAEVASAPVVALSQNVSDLPVDAPAAPKAQGEPAARNNGVAASQAAEILRQRLEPLGLDGKLLVAFGQNMADELQAIAPAALSRGILVAPASAAALAAHNAAQAGLSGQSIIGNGTTLTAVVPSTNGSVSAPITDAESFLGRGQSQGNGAGSTFEGQGLATTSDGDGGVFAGADSLDDFGSSFGTLLSNQTATATAARPAGIPAPPAPPTPPSFALDQVAVQVAAAARNGERQITMQLRPASLGRIDIQLSVGRDGAVRARVLAERQETLELLERDATGLQTAIEAAGLRAETGGLSFGLKDGGQNGQPTFGEAPLPASLVAMLDGDRTHATPSTQSVASPDGRALDIRV